MPKRKVGTQRQEEGKRKLNAKIEEKEKEGRTSPTVVVGPALSPTGIIICSVCWSRPDVSARHNLALFGKRGWSLTAIEPVGKESFKVSCKYPCSNPECSAHIAITWTLGWSKQESLMTSGAKQLSGKEAAAYLAGTTTRQGVFVRGT